MALFEERPLTRRAAEKSFSDRLIALSLKIPKGKVTTYGALAKAAGGGAMAARSVTGILSKAWEAGEKKIPFHRIVYSDGHIWEHPEYEKKRRRLYKEEGIKLDENNRIVDFQEKLYAL